MKEPEDHPVLKKSRNHHFPDMDIVLKQMDPNKRWDVTTAFGISNSPFGDFFLAFAEEGIVSLWLTADEDGEQVVRNFRKMFGDRLWMSRDDRLAQTLTEEFLAFDRPKDLCVYVHGTPFQLSVWSALMDIPFGETVTYGELARRMGRPTAVRAVASAVASNRIAYLIPCHRVVRSDGSLGNYRWGAAKKAEMIAWEKRLRAQMEESLKRRLSEA